jgi:carboxylesterase
MTEPAILPGAEPFSAPGGRHGVLILHGFTGSPQSMRPLAEAFAAAGFTVELPRLPGHGTTVDDMATTTWSDWRAAAGEAFDELASRCDDVLLAGLSMGGTLVLSLAVEHPEVSGVVAINALAEVTDPALIVGLDELAATGLERLPGIASDIAKEGAVELAYEEVPLPALLSLLHAAEALAPRLGEITAPVLILNSPQDHVVDPASSERLASSVKGPVERVTLTDSFHVATLDNDAPLIEREAVAFAQRVTS